MTTLNIFTSNPKSGRYSTSKDTKTFDNPAKALIYIAAHPGPGYEIVRPRKPKVAA